MPAFEGPVKTTSAPLNLMEVSNLNWPGMITEAGPLIAEPSTDTSTEIVEPGAAAPGVTVMVTGQLLNSSGIGTKPVLFGWQ